VWWGAEVKRALLIVVALVLLSAAAVVALNLRGESPVDTGAFTATPQQVQRGATLAIAGNCVGCHTARGGTPYAGGRAIDTPFGTVFATNLTPDAATGLGSWSAGHFWRALHNGRSKDGRLLYPAFPYPNYTLVTREDADAIFAYLRSLPPVAQRNRPHVLRFPFDSQAALGIWRAMFFTPESYEPDAARPADWNRGAYLVRGLGHCNACHASRNIFGATSENLELSGGLIPMQQWYAPSLSADNEAGVAHWETQQVVDLMKKGVSPRGSVMGPMAEVVYRSTQYWSDDDLRAIAVFLKALPQAQVGEDTPGLMARVATFLRLKRDTVDPELVPRGEKIYANQCAQCHGERGEGVAGAYPPLAGNRAVTMDPPANLIRVLLSGGYPPSTAGNPRPFGMPPFAHVLDDADIAAVVSYVRGAWGNKASQVPASEVLHYRR
jgi:mono/diheme cytochrome c family protein